MSWDAYIDNVIANSKSADESTHVDKVCIFGKDGSAWTSDSHANALVATGPEKSKISAELAKGRQTEFGATGIVIGGVKYQFLRIDEDASVAYGKKKGAGAITVQASKTAVIVAHCPEGGQHGICNDAVSKVAIYLINAGY